jgi:hypothetical protein
MQWEFSAEEVVKGAVDYRIAEFRRDFHAEVRANTGGWLGEEGARACFDVLYDYTYWLATGRPREAFILLPDAPVDREFLAAVHDALAPNVEMLGAILQRMIMDGVEQGLVLDEALSQAARRHGEAVAEPIPLTCESA